MILKCLYLHKLKQIHAQYGDVTIRDEAKMGDPAYPNVDENIIIMKLIWWKLTGVRVVHFVRQKIILKMSMPALKETNQPAFSTPKLHIMAFPVQFPTGENTLDEKRCIKLILTII